MFRCTLKGLGGVISGDLGRIFSKKSIMYATRQPMVALRLDSVMDLNFGNCVLPNSNSGHVYAPYGHPEVSIHEGKIKCPRFFGQFCQPPKKLSSYTHMLFKSYL